MKKCTNCGAEMIDEAVLCVQCGKMYKPNQASEKKKTNGAVVAIVIFFSAFFAALVSILIGSLIYG